MSSRPRFQHGQALRASPNTGLSSAPGATTELFRLADLSNAILDDAGRLIHAMPYRAGTYGERTPLVHKIRAEGLDL